MKLTLPKTNMTSGRKKPDTNNSCSQLCVIPNTDDNRKAIKHLNKLAKEQGSKYRFVSKWRLPKEGTKYGYFGELKPSDAKGIGLYLKYLNVPSYRPNTDYINKLKEENLELKQSLKECTHPNFDKDRYDWEYTKDKISELEEDNMDLSSDLIESKKKYKDYKEMLIGAMNAKDDEIDSLKQTIKFSRMTAEERAYTIISEQVEKWQGSDEIDGYYDDGRWEDVNYEINNIMNQLKKQYKGSE